MEKRVYTISETAQVFQVSTSFIRKLIYSGQIPVIKLGSRRLIPASAIEEILASSREVKN
ncbi:helix-turn-helix domain-containing protein [Neomoorella humiferrea]|uniref:helix-turn-helix domain-containing protein n=1 Tax=Neomoorella humiferrea TaxID=676965 RepID=UPI003BB1CB3C